MKKQCTLLLALLFTVLAGQAQSTSKLYGFSQVVTPGMAKRETDERGAVTQGARNYNYQVYLTSSLPTRIYPIELWIKGKRYSVKEEIITETPVQYTNIAARNPEPVTLVPQTTDKVLKLNPVTYTGMKNYPKARQLAASNEVVAVYKQGGAIRYKTLKTLTALGTQSMQ